MCVGDFRSRGKPREAPATVVDSMRVATREVVRAYANRQCGCDGCSSHAYLSIQALGLALSVRHTFHQISDRDFSCCLDELRQAAERVRAIEIFNQHDYVEGRMQ